MWSHLLFLSELISIRYGFVYIIDLFLYHVRRLYRLIFYLLLPSGTPIEWLGLQTLEPITKTSSFSIILYICIYSTHEASSTKFPAITFCHKYVFWDIWSLQISNFRLLLVSTSSDCVGSGGCNNMAEYNSKESYFHNHWCSRQFYITKQK